jgi:hypothetical protein
MSADIKMEIKSLEKKCSDAFQLVVIAFGANLLAMLAHQITHWLS